MVRIRAKFSVHVTEGGHTPSFDGSRDDTDNRRERKIDMKVRLLNR